MLAVHSSFRTIDALTDYFDDLLVMAKFHTKYWLLQ